MGKRNKTSTWKSSSSNKGNSFLIGSHIISQLITCVLLRDVFLVMNWIITSVSQAWEKFKKSLTFSRFHHWQNLLSFFVSCFFVWFGLVCFLISISAAGTRVHVKKCLCACGWNGACVSAQTSTRPASISVRAALATAGSSNAHTHLLSSDHSDL